MLAEINSLLSYIPNYKITQTWKEANQTADGLANKAIEDQNHNAAATTTTSWEFACQLQDVVFNDRIGTTYPRVVTSTF